MRCAPGTGAIIVSHDHNVTEGRFKVDTGNPVIGMDYMSSQGLIYYLTLCEEQMSLHLFSLDCSSFPQPVEIASYPVTTSSAPAFSVPIACNPLNNHVFVTQNRTV